ncbi:hypothetical protein BSNK01_28420 [Bacillaceae bacterium]
MYNWMVVEKETGKIINAISTPNEGVLPQADEVQEILEITQEDFEGIFDERLKYYNYDTKQLEPENIRKWVLKTPGPYQAGIISLVFEQQDLNGQPITVPVAATVFINEQSHEVTVDDGALEIELDCPAPTMVRIKIEAYRHETLETEVVIGG